MKQEKDKEKPVKKPDEEIQTGERIEDEENEVITDPDKPRPPKPPSE